jgi:hypothetical protein
MVGGAATRGQAVPDAPVAGALRTSCPGRHAGLVRSLYRLGAGRCILNSLRVRQALGQDPTAERLLWTMLRYAAREVTGAPAELPADLEEHLQELGYR